MKIYVISKSVDGVLESPEVFGEKDSKIAEERLGELYRGIDNKLNFRMDIFEGRSVFHRWSTS